MPFNCLVLTCLHKNHSYTEDTVKISFTNSKEFDEKVLFFNIDDNPNQKSRIREFIAYPHEIRYTGQIAI